MEERRNSIANALEFCLSCTNSSKCTLGLWAVGCVEFSTKCHHWATITKVNSLASGKFKLNFRHVIFKQIVVIDGWGISYEIAALRWMPLDLTDDKSILVQVMAWCHQATSHYLNQCWPRSLSPSGITRPQWFKLLQFSQIYFFISTCFYQWVSYLVVISFCPVHHKSLLTSNYLHRTAVNCGPDSGISVPHSDMMDLITGMP